MTKRKKKYAVVNQKECVACGSCVLVCPVEAIKIKNGCYAEVNYDKCVGCGRCSAICPASVIKMEVSE